MKGCYAFVRAVVLSGLALGSTLSVAEAPMQWAQIPMQDKQIRHGLLLWVDRVSHKPYTPVLDKKAASRGHEVYLSNCTRCHGSSGKGDGPEAKGAKRPPTDLTKLGRSLDSHYVVLQVAVGKGQMPAWKDTLTEKQIWDLSHYLRSLATAK